MKEIKYYDSMGGNNSRLGLISLGLALVFNFDRQSIFNVHIYAGVSALC